MTTQHEARAQKFYGGRATAPAPRAPSAASPGAQRLYPPSAQGGGSIENAVDAWKTRRRAKFIDDKERRDQVDLEARQFQAYAINHGWSPAEAQAVLAKQAEREALPRSEETKEKAVLSWTKRNFAWLYSQNPKVAAACLVEGMTYDPEARRIIKTYPAEGLRTVAAYEYLDVDSPTIPSTSTAPTVTSTGP